MSSTNPVLTTKNTTQPKPDKLTGFYRGSAYSDREESQEEFLRKRSKNDNQEMPPELIKFMRDLGPLQKFENTSQIVNKDQNLPPKLKKTRAPRGMRDEENSSKSSSNNSQQKSSNEAHKATDTRRQERMRLVAGIEGHETTRTTDFSQLKEAVDANDIGIDLLKIYSLLQGNIVVNPALDESAREQHEKLIHDTQQFLDLPVILRDSDGSYIGAKQANVAKLQELYEGIQPLPKSEAILVLEDLWKKESNMS